VDDLLAFAKAGGQVVDRSARTPVLASVRAIFEEAAALAESRAVELRIDPRSVDAAVACPPGVLASLLSNLVRNAIKYIGASPQKRVVVGTARIGRYVRIDVEDTGPGLPPGSEDKVFDAYVRADRSGQPGLGLGLATVKRFAEAYGGCVGVHSGSGGCTFWLELPLAIEK
jgi:signal transduction histidine kinase